MALASTLKRGDTARHIVDGLRTSGTGGTRIEVVLSERAAVARAFEVANEGDLVVLLVHNIASVLQQLTEMGAARGIMRAAQPSG